MFIISSPLYQNCTRYLYSSPFSSSIWDGFKVRSSFLQVSDPKHFLRWLKMARRHFGTRSSGISSSSPQNHAVSAKTILNRCFLRRQCPVRKPVRRCSLFLLRSKLLLDLLGADEPLSSQVQAKVPALAGPSCYPCYLCIHEAKSFKEGLNPF